MAYLKRSDSFRERRSPACGASRQWISRVAMTSRSEEFRPCTTRQVDKGVDAPAIALGSTRSSLVCGGRHRDHEEEEHDMTTRQRQQTGIERRDKREAVRRHCRG